MTAEAKPKHCYDLRCEELARYFIEDEKATEVQVQDLAQGIQDYIEDWIYLKDLENEQRLEAEKGSF